jgi:hypothetical protein
MRISDISELYSMRWEDRNILNIMNFDITLIENWLINMFQIYNIKW